MHTSGASKERHRPQKQYPPALLAQPPLSFAAPVQASQCAGLVGVLVFSPAHRRIDLPALGPQTIAGAARAGLAGIVFEADGVLFEAPDACIEQANRAGLFLYGLTPEEL